MNQTADLLADANATLVDDEQKQMLAVAAETQIQPATAQTLQQRFAPLFASARSTIEKSRAIVVTSPDQKLEIKLARACRLELKALRVSGEKTRREIKEEYVRTGRAIDGFHAILEHLIVGEEKRLDAQERFVEIQEHARKAALIEERTKILTDMQADATVYQLGEMTAETFNQLVEGIRLARVAAEERRRREEAERIERETKERAEQERMRLENERLKREADEREAKAKLEREMAEAELRRLAEEKRAAEEKALAEREAFEAAAKAELERRQNLHAERRAIMQPLVAGGDESANGFYGDMTDDQFGEAKAGAENRRDARIKLEREKAAADELARKEREVAEAERTRLAAETARKLAEQKRRADEAAKAAREREAALLAEQKRIQAEIQDAKDAQARREAERREEARRAAAAPDRDKLLNYANAIRALDVPTFFTPEAQALARLVASQRDKFAAWLEEKAGAL